LVFCCCTLFALAAMNWWSSWKVWNELKVPGFASPTMVLALVSVLALVLVFVLVLVEPNGVRGGNERIAVPATISEMTAKKTAALRPTPRRFTHCIVTDTAQGV
jgi:hypothetical protein